MADFDYLEDDKKKVVPLGPGPDEYPADPDDIPPECWEAADDEALIKVPTGRAHLLKALRIRYPVVDESGEAVAGMQYRIILPSGAVIYGETDSEGIYRRLTSTDDGDGYCQSLCHSDFAPARSICRKSW